MSLKGSESRILVPVMYFTLRLKTETEISQYDFRKVDIFLLPSVE